MSGHNDSSGQIVKKTNEVYQYVFGNYRSITDEELKKKLGGLKKITAKYFDSAPSEEKPKLARYVLLKIFKIARLMSYIDRKEVLPDILSRSKEIYLIVNDGIGTLSAIEALTKIANPEKTFREFLSFGGTIKKYEKTGTIEQ